MTNGELSELLARAVDEQEMVQRKADASSVTRQGQLQAAGLVMLSAISVQASAAMAFGLFAATSTSGVVWLRTTSGAIILCLIALASRKRFSQMTPKLVFEMAFVMAITNASFYEAISRLPLGDAVGIEYLGPITVAVATSNRRRDLIWITLALLGVLSISQREAGPLNFLGVIFVLLAGSGWGAYTIIGRRIAERGQRETTLALSMSISSFLLLPTALIRSGPTLWHAPILAAGALVGLMGSAIPYTVELMAMSRVPTSTIGVLLSLQPFMAAVVGLVFLHQPLSPPELLGFSMVTIAAAGVALSRPQIVPPAPQAEAIG